MLGVGLMLGGMGFDVNVSFHKRSHILKFAIHDIKDLMHAHSKIGDKITIVYSGLDVMFVLT